ncbi:MAG: hypothetical protein H6669_08730 [Ardenticatenaceae bacterium]|nr:hypothetical protein [Ardenticatenaceae bacterium]
MPKQKVADDPESITELEQILEKAYALNDAGKLEDALTHCQQAINLHPQSAEACNLKGLILDRLGERQAAIAAFQKAVHFDPEFQEAQQNLAEVQAEIDNVETKNLKLSAAWYMTKWGAFSFGLALAVYEILSGAWIILISSNPIFGNPLLNTMMHTFLFAIFVGIAIAIIGSEVYGKALLFGLVGAAASGFAYIITGTTISVFGNFSSNPIGPIPIIIRFACLGTIIGISIAILQKNRTLTWWLIFAGTASWAFHGWSPLRYVLFGQDTNFLLIFYRAFGEMGFNLGVVLAKTVYSAFDGLIIGGLWGWVIGWFEAPRLFELEE